MRNYLQRTNRGETSLFDAFDDFFRPIFAEENHSLSTNIRENENEYLLENATPGFTKDQIKLSLENGYLNVVCSKQTKNETSDDNKDENKGAWRRKEISEYSARSFYLGDEVAQEDIKAKYENGILSLTIPKSRPKVPEKSYIAIE